jgi:xyloglucan-specific endo-beta-1,4-glucanase
MKSAILAAAAISIGLSAATPTPTLEKRAASSCGQWDSATAGSYVIYNNLWGESSATSGSQCLSLDSTSPVAWTSTWSWSGGQYSVKSYANAVYNGYSPLKLSAIGSIPTAWSWSYTGSDLVADVSYDLFTSSAASTSNEEYEIMVWLAALGGAGESREG